MCGAHSLRLRRVNQGALFFLAALLGAELVWQLLDGDGAAATLAGLITFFLQPFLVLLGLAVLHRREAIAP